MGAYNQLLIFFLFLVIAACTNAQREKKFFRKDYKYIDSTQSFYKFHKEHKTWQDAQAVCEMEGASLFYPNDQNEANAIIEYWNQTQPFDWVYIGVSALVINRVFETVDDDLPISKVYNNWGPGEPNDANGKEDCVILRRDGSLNDVECSNMYSFVCKKTLSSLEWNYPCNMPNLDYKYNETLGKCYKFHLDPKNWQDSYAACSAEQSYLAIIDSEQEHQHLIQMIAEAPKDDITGNYLRGAVSVGFLRRKQGWVTITGVKLEKSGFGSWEGNQPDGGDNETCGTIFNTGELNDLSCTVYRVFFICEHDPIIENNFIEDVE